MALSLGFHIIFATVGVAMPFLMACSHALYLRRKEEKYLLLTKAWSKGVAIFFAVGAVSGTALSFELGLLWPGFMRHAGVIIGMPFSWEGAAFFLEAIALGIFLYGWGRLSPWTHWLSGFLVGVMGVMSAAFVICANSWMNAPAGFDWNAGNPINIDPVAAMFNKAAPLQILHMLVACFQALGFAVAGLHALLYLRKGYDLHLSALKIAFVFAAVASLIQPVVGDLIAKDVAVRQPAKLAAMEGHFHTDKGVALSLGGWPDEEKEELRYALKIPKMLSFLAFGSFEAEVLGLDRFDREDWPPVAIVHLAFQIMVGLGTLMLIFSLALGIYWWRRKFPAKPWLMRVFVAFTPLGFIALEAGWIVTEVGRQPWIIHGILRTREALTPRPGIVYTFALYCLLYLFLTFVVSFLLARQTQLLHREIEKGRT
jgi:cytochrome d ubiquinol oxidase subunit I